MTKLTVHAQRALERMHESASLNWFIRSDAARNDAHCTTAYQPNLRFNESLEYYLGAQQVIHSADTLNSYCQSILAEILSHAPETWEKIKPTLDTKKSIQNYIDVLRSHCGIDGQIREVLRDHLQCNWSPESDVVVKLRNKFVHQNGHDPNREVEKVILSKKDEWSIISPVELIGKPIPVRYENDHWLQANAELGHWACLHISNHIHFMDQNVSHVYRLPKDRWQPRPVSRQIGATVHPNNPTWLAPGQSLTQSTMEIQSDNEPKIVYPKAKEEDILCSKTWRTWQDLLESEIEPYIKKLNLQLVAGQVRVVGNPLPHTLTGQERHREWSLLPSVPHERASPELISIRFRESHLKPFMTIWGTSSVVRDFPEGQEEKAMEYLKDCIDKTLTTNS